METKNRKKQEKEEEPYIWKKKTGAISLPNKHGHNIRNRGWNPKVQLQKFCLTERDTIGCIDHQKTGRSDSSQRKTCFDDNRGVEIHRQNCVLYHLNASGRNTSTLAWPKKQQPSHCGRCFKPITKSSPPCRNSYWFDNYSTWRWETDSATSHINTFNRVLSKISSKGINFEEEVKALALLSSLKVR